MAGKLTGFSPGQLREMWTKPGLEGWLEYFKEKVPERQWEKQADNLVGLCLWHADTTPSMRFTPQKQMSFCFACQTGRFDLLEFLQELLRKTVDEIYYDLAQRFNLRSSPEIEEILRYETKISTFKKEFVLTASTALQRAADDEADYAYGSRALRYLQERGIDVQQAYTTRIGIMPTKGQVYHALSPESQTVLDEYLPDTFVADPNAIGPYGGQLVFPYFVTPTRIGRIKIKPPERGTNPRWLGASAKETRGFFGLQMFPMIIGDPRERHHNRVVVVEGEMDQLSYAQEQLKSHPTDQIPVVCGSGGGVEDMSMLTDCGLRDFVIAGDNDTGGVSFVKRLLSEASQDKIRKISIFKWPSSLATYNDPDEVVQGNKYEEFRDALLDSQNLQEPHEWALDQVVAEHGALIAPTSKEKIDLARKYGSLLKSELDYDQFRDNAASTLNVKISLLDKHVTDIETDDGFVRAIERALIREFIPLVFTSQFLKVYGVKTKRIAEFPVNPAKALQMSVQSVLGMRIYDWVDHVVGIPDWISFKPSKQGPIPVMLERKMMAVEKHFDMAFQALASQAKPKTDFAVLRQGLHYIPDSHPKALAGLDKGEQAERYYFVNGEMMFIGRPKRVRIHWEQLHVPSHGAFLFEPDIAERWTEHVTSARHLEDGDLLPPEEMFHKIREPLAKGWRYLPDDIHATFLAGYIMATRILPCFKSIPLVFLTAPSRSGKSTMMQGILSPSMYPHICMLEGSTGYDDYTAAFMQQVSGGSTQLRCWDEFEDPAYADGHKKTEMNKALQMIRNLSSGAVRGRGTRTGSSRQERIFYPLVAAGIHVFQRDVDANRFLTVEFDKTDGFHAPDKFLQMTYGDEYFAQIRKWTTLAPVIALPRLMEMYETVENEILASGEVKYRSSRTARALIPVCVMLKWANQPYLEFAQAYIQLQEDRLMASSVTPEEGIFRAVFQTNAITIRNEHVRHSILALLSEPLNAAHLSEVDVGVYWLAGEDFVVLYPDKLPTLLRNNPAFRNMNNTNQIHQLLSRHPLVQSDPRFFMRRPSVLQHLRKFIAKPDIKELLYVKLSDLDYSQADEVRVEGLDPSEEM